MLDSFDALRASLKSPLRNESASTTCSRTIGSVSNANIFSCVRLCSVGGRKLPRLRKRRFFQSFPYYSACAEFLRRWRAAAAEPVLLPRVPRDRRACCCSLWHACSMSSLEKFSLSRLEGVESIFYAIAQNGHPLSSGGAIRARKLAVQSMR